MVLDSAVGIGSSENDSAIADSDDDENGLEINFANGPVGSSSQTNTNSDSSGLHKLHLRHLLQSVLQDAQTRLFFKAQAVVQAEIAHYVPRPADLEYPEVLVRSTSEGNRYTFILLFTRYSNNVCSKTTVSYRACASRPTLYRL